MECAEREVSCFTPPVPSPSHVLFPPNSFLPACIYHPLWRVFSGFSKHLLTSFLAVLQTQHSVLSPFPHFDTFFTFKQSRTTQMSCHEEISSSALWQRDPEWIPSYWTRMDFSCHAVIKASKGIFASLRSYW